MTNCIAFSFPLWMSRPKTLFATLLVAALFSGGAAQPPDMPPVPVTTGIVEEGAYSQPIRLTGSVEPFAQTAIGVEEDGVVDRLFVEAGDFVTSGAPLLQMRQLPLRLAADRAAAETSAALGQELDQAAAELTSAAIESAGQVNAEARQAIDQASASLRDATGLSAPPRPGPPPPPPGQPASSLPPPTHPGSRLLPPLPPPASLPRTVRPVGETSTPVAPSTVLATVRSLSTRSFSALAPPPAALSARPRPASDGRDEAGPVEAADSPARSAAPPAMAPPPADPRRSATSADDSATAPGHHD